MIESRIIGSQSSKLLADPANFLHALDVEADRAIFVPTTRDLLSDAAFVDGRSPIATAPPQEARLSDLLRTARPEPSPERFIFHMSFCGSTLLGRLLDVPGRSLVLKEPNCLVDLATWKSLNLRAGRPNERLGPSLQLARAALRRPFALGEAVTVKPSSWVNILLDELTADGEHILPLFVTINRASFLRASFRGGTDRLAFTAQLAWHMASGNPEGDELLQGAVEAADSPLGRAANLAVLAHDLQLATFERAMRRGGWGGNRLIDFSEIGASPLDAAVSAARALRLGLEPEELELTVQRHAGTHSKNASIGYSADQRNADDQAVDSHHREPIEAAIGWAHRTFGPERAAQSAGQRA